MIKNYKNNKEKGQMNMLKNKKDMIATNTVKKIRNSIALFSVGCFLTSCAATTAVIEHRNLETTTRLSQTIFLDPVSSSQKTIFIDVKNTSEQQLNLKTPLAQAFKAKGYQVLRNPSQAHYWLQANIKTIGKMSESASQNALLGGYGSVLATAGVGVAIGSLSDSRNTMIASGLAGGVIGLAADALIKNVNYTMITDVQISEHVGRGNHIQESYQASLSQGTSSVTTQTLNKQTSFQKYRTRVVSNANQVNLSFDKAKASLTNGLVKTLSGIF